MKESSENDTKGQSGYQPPEGSEIHVGPHDIRGEDGPVKGRAWHGFHRKK